MRPPSGVNISLEIRPRRGNDSQDLGGGARLIDTDAQGVL
jgi:hypothetical protein